MKIIFFLIVLNVIALNIKGQDTTYFFSENNYLKIYELKAEFRFGNRIGCGYLERKNNRLIIIDDTRLDCMCSETSFEFFPDNTESEYIEYEFEVRNRTDISIIDSKDLLIYGLINKKRYLVAWPNDSGNLAMRVKKNVKEIHFVVEITHFLPKRFVLNNDTSGKLVLYFDELPNDYIYYANSSIDYMIKCDVKENGIFCSYKDSRNFKKNRQKTIFLKKME